jgi:hypothetical protein
MSQFPTVSHDRPPEDDAGVPRPRVLLVATLHWFFPVRFALELRRAGFDVEVACPPGHLFGRLSVPPPRHMLRTLRELSDLEAAIRDAGPSMVIPCDDRAYTCLQRLRARTQNDAVRRVLTVSSSGVLSAVPIARKGELIALARELGLPAPATRTIGRDTGPAGFADMPCPFVLKRDGAWSGKGVRIVKDQAEARRAWRELIRPPSAFAFAKLVIFEGLRVGIDRLFERPQGLDAQQFIAGRAANRACLFKDGVELAGVSAVCHETSFGGTGPSSVIKVIDHEDMARAARELGRTLNLTGFFGFDFVLSDTDGRAYLLETNPRVTPLSTIACADRPFLPETLYEMLTGRPPNARAERIAREAIAIFPDEWARDPASPFLSSAHHDVPWSEPALVRHGLKVVQQRRILARIRNALSRLRR